MIPIVEVIQLSKAYGRQDALTRLSFVVERGDIYGLIGPNGAGKTTSLSILAGLVSSSSGKARILGMEVESNRRELVARVGFSSPQLSFFDYLKGAEVLLTCALMHRLEARTAEKRMKDLLALLDLEAAADHFLYQYSQGMRQKLGLACALIHAPEVLLLDEPFTALDPASAYRIFHTLKRMSAGGRTIVLTSHDLVLVERLCTRAGILHAGILRREIELNQVETNGAGTAAESKLEAALWEVVGRPEFEELSWV